MADSDDNLLPLSALQHLLYCERQCALIHLEQVWEENRLTAEGAILHERAHDGPDEHRAGVHITRGLAVHSLALQLSGQCDVVEFHLREGTSLPRGAKALPRDVIASVIPIEYKRGRPKSHHADEVQLCAQALCLEEMLDCHIDFGHLYYGQKRRRTEIEFDEKIRTLTHQTATRLHALIASGRTPPPSYDKAKCDDCSLIEICMPRMDRRRMGAARWLSDALTQSLKE
ncbi:CRISPR-associated protein Cas4 [Thiorhodococcus drewsii AZ1]|uniref:CRISPR-associated exonuclease Cas4 n=1 Tax=Thiorhodococcus drewsii AZ1 TaxID=765913 RepID=G2E5S0_9GAMM|nr:CRISPR-associated protein Cas4 [Thiorhodococcus drewsii]EGV28565.1 CRISPR-associated protein Cas4 [Thiorhodococcus drewsii AZ1]